MAARHRTLGDCQRISNVGNPVPPNLKGVQKQVDLPIAELIGIAVCLVISGFFSGAETALTSLSEVKVHQLIEENPKWGRPLLHWKNNHRGILTTILIANNVANITASALAADWASRYFTNNGIPIAIGAMTLLLLFSGEITPKTFARRYSTTIALPVIRVVLVFHILLYPASWIITKIINLLFKLIGGDTAEGTVVTERDIEFAVSLGGKEGAIDKQKQNLLSSIFEFTDTIAKEIMVPRTDLVTLLLDTPYDQVLDISLKSGFSRIPVRDGTIDKIAGIFYAKDLLPAPKPSEKNKFLHKRSRPAVFIPESKKISEVLKLFQKDRIHLAIVVNEFGGTEGIVTLEDIIEELLGEIQDEFDVEESRLRKMPDGSYTADARVDIEELEEAMNISFPEEREYESLGGFLMEKAGDVPAQGWSQNFEKFRFKVTEADANKVITVKITPITPRKRQTAGDAEDSPGAQASSK